MASRTPIRVFLEPKSCGAILDTRKNAKKRRKKINKSNSKWMTEKADLHCTAPSHRQLPCGMQSDLLNELQMAHAPRWVEPEEMSIYRSQDCLDENAMEIRDGRARGPHSGSNPLDKRDLLLAGSLSSVLPSLTQLPTQSFSFPSYYHHHLGRSTWWTKSIL